MCHFSCFQRPPELIKGLHPFQDTPVFYKLKLRQTDPQNTVFVVP